MNVINVSLLKTYKSKFSSEKQEFTSKAYAAFNSGYIKRCSDSYVIKMKNKLQTLYDKVDAGYDNIEEWWINYNNDIESLEKVLAREASVGSIRETSVRNYVNFNLNEFNKYTVGFWGAISLVFDSSGNSYGESFDLENMIAASNMFGEIDMSRINDGSYMLELTEKWLEVLRTETTNNISQLESERTALEEKYNKFVSRNDKEASWASMIFASFSSNPDAPFLNQYQNVYDNSMKTFDSQYIEEHAKEFEEYMGMSYDEYKQKIDELNGNIAYLEAYDYTLRQQAKELPYIQLMNTEEYQIYVTNRSNGTNFAGVTDSKEYALLSFKYKSSLEYLTVDQKNMFDYLFDTQGEEAASTYLDKIEDSINQAKGMAEANEFLNSITNEDGTIDAGLMEQILTTGKGLGVGWENFFEGIENLFDFTSDGIKTDNQYAQMFILQSLAQAQENGNLADVGEFFLSNNFQISTSIGNMLPGTIISTLTTPTIGQIFMGLSAAGNSKNDALINGSNVFQAYLYGSASGASEAIIGKLLGNIPGLNENAKFAFKEILSEGAEELTQEYVDAGFRAIFLGETVDLTELNENALKSFIYGSITSGIMTGGQVTINVSIGGVKYTFDSLNDLYNSYKNGKLTSSNTSVSDNVASIKDKISRYNELYNIMHTENYLKHEAMMKAYGNNLSYGNVGVEIETIRAEFESLKAELMNAKDNGTIDGVWSDSEYRYVFNEKVSNNTTNANIVDNNQLFKSLVSQLGINGAMKAVWNFAYGGDLSYIPAELRAQVQSLSVEQAESFLESPDTFVSQDNNTNSNNINSNSDIVVLQEKIRAANSKFNLADFYNGKSGCSGAVLVITPQQVIMASADFTGVDEHGFAVEEIYRGLYGQYSFESGYDALMWQEQAVKTGNIVIQLCSGSDNIISTPNNITSSQYEALKCFNEQIKNIFQQNGSFSDNPIEFVGWSSEITDTNSIDGLLNELSNSVDDNIPRQNENNLNVENELTRQLRVANDVSNNLKELQLNVNYDSNDLSATLKTIPIGNLIDIVRDVTKFNEFKFGIKNVFNFIKNRRTLKFSKNDYYVAFVQLVNAIKENNYNMGFNQVEQQRLDEIYNEALKTLPINKIQYSNFLPNDIKLKIMVRDNVAYDRELLMKEFKNKIESEDVFSNPYFIFDDLFLLYYNDVSRTLTHNEIIEKYYDFSYCDTIYLSCLSQILEQNIELSREQFKKLVNSIGDYVRIPVVQNYLNKHFSIYPDVDDFLYWFFDGGMISVSTLSDKNLKSTVIDSRELLAILNDSNKFFTFLNKNSYDYFYLSAFNVMYQKLVGENNINIGLSDIASNRLIKLHDIYVTNVADMYNVMSQKEKMLQERGLETTVIDGIRYSVPRNFNEFVQSWSVDKVSNLMSQIPGVLRNYVKEINIYDEQNPADVFWAIAYNIPNFSSAATGGNGCINIYSPSSKSNISDFMHTIYHEIAHSVDNRTISLSQEWNDAVSNDGNYYTEYSSVDSKEDFADSVAAFFLEYNSFFKKCPNRARFLYNLFMNLGGI